MEGETTIRQRKVPTEDGDNDADETVIPQAKDDTPEILKDALKDLTPRWKNWWVRGLYGNLLILFFFFIVHVGPLLIMVVVLCIQVKCFHEIITIGHQVYKSYDLPWFRSLSWYFLFCVNFFFYGETWAEMFVNLTGYETMTVLLRYHRMSAFLLYLVGFILFVLSLVKKKYRLQFFMFGWTHVTLLIIVTQSHLIIQNLFEGVIWLIVPVSMVICNDIMAYVCGFFFGRTPLIKLSPKKTWEGFIGGGIFTVIFGWLFSGFLSQYQFLICPAELGADLSVTTNCGTPSAFLLQEYNVPMFVQVLLKMVGLNFSTIQAVPFQFHCLVFSLFSSVIAPFGGFFASGFKRAFKIKDFGDVIPGHGGLMDRFDCQYLMATFVHVYMSTFIRVPSPHKVLPLIMAMKPTDQVWIFEKLKEHLANGVV